MEMGSADQCATSESEDNDEARGKAHIPYRLCRHWTLAAFADFGQHSRRPSAKSLRNFFT